MYYGEIPPSLAAPAAVAAILGIIMYFAYLFFILMSTIRGSKVVGEVYRIDVSLRRWETVFKQRNGSRYVDRPSVYRIFYSVRWHGQEVRGQTVYADDPFWARTPPTRRVKQLVKRVVDDGDRKIDISVRKGRSGVKTSIWKGPAARHCIFAMVACFGLFVVVDMAYAEHLSRSSVIIGAVLGVFMFCMLFGREGQRWSWEPLWVAEAEASRAHQMGHECAASTAQAKRRH